ncbi:hypothetical protein [Haloferax volcanii]|uniref:Uncharacterized protein n=2 Tax=Haloferax volcanii TaxID=2246 RepID=D4GZZ6_HALVD|nr:hypothetical protein [Haloferax volcanii]ADE02824.1 uncharacterized protein HVO_0370 [Haloferax volcanii DS2]MBS8119046.1 hypothetical protein [Haloferax volcanii]MBS8124059.1 hypothetical protein [Haloferax volcanii]MBS8127928.1 hypothetical protein [Haloferax volcanii]MBS8131793.1 hypothetical protein [Haloferax volcanii]
MPGRAPWGQSGTKGSGETLAVNNRPTIVTKSFGQTATVAAGSKQTTNIYAPEGKVWKVIGMELEAPNPGGDGSGDHFFYVWSAGHVRMMNGGGPDDDAVYWRNSTWSVNSAAPQDTAASLNALTNLKATESKSIRITYNGNNLTADQTGHREIKFVFEEVSY